MLPMTYIHIQSKVPINAEVAIKWKNTYFEILSNSLKLWIEIMPLREHLTIKAVPDNSRTSPPIDPNLSYQKGSRVFKLVKSLHQWEKAFKCKAIPESQRIFLKPVR